MVEQSKNGDEGGLVRLRCCWLLGVVWLFTFYGSLSTNGSTFAIVLNAVQMVLLIVIMALHASLLYGWLGLAFYCGVSISIGLSMEASSVATGFPFGSFVHHSPGPQLLGVPLQAMLIYMYLGWFAWALARVVCLDDPSRLTGIARCGAPLVAALILAGVDYPIDPILSTVFGLWTFEHPSGQFGVPITNLAGWAFTGAIIFLAMSLVDRRFRATPVAGSRSFWLLPCCIWIAQAAQYPILWMRAPPGSVQLGVRTFVTSDIFEASLAASLFSILFVAVLALIRLFQIKASPIE